MVRKLVYGFLISLIVVGTVFAARYGSNQNNLLTNTELAIWSEDATVAGAAMTATNGPDNWGQSGATAAVESILATYVPEGHVNSMLIYNQSAVTDYNYHLFYPEAAVDYANAKWYNSFEGKTVCFGYLYNTYYGAHTSGASNIVRAYVDTSSDSSVSQFGTWRCGGTAWTWAEDAFVIPSEVTGFRVGLQVIRGNTIPGTTASGNSVYVAAPRLVVDRYIGGDLIPAAGNMTWLDVPFYQESFAGNGVGSGVTSVDLTHADYDNANRIPVGYARTYVVGLSTRCSTPYASGEYGWVSPSNLTGVSLHASGGTNVQVGAQVQIPANHQGGVSLFFGANHSNVSLKYLGVEAR